MTAAYAISGLFDLRPLVSTSINTALKLDDASARAVSPLFWNSPARGTLDAVVGGNESAEYFRQSRMIVDAWNAAGIATRFGDNSRRQPFYRHRAACRSQLADDAAAEATGGTLWGGRRLRQRGDGPNSHLRKITLSLK